MSHLNEILAIRDRMQIMEKQARQTLTAELRAAGDDTHFYKASLQHYTDWLIVNGYITIDRHPVNDYLDAMEARSLPRRTMRRTRKMGPAPTPNTSGQESQPILQTMQFPSLRTRQGNTRVSDHDQS